MVSRNHLVISILSAIILFDWMMVHTPWYFLAVIAGAGAGCVLRDMDLSRLEADAGDGTAGTLGLFFGTVLNPAIAKFFELLVQRPVDPENRNIARSIFGNITYCFVFWFIGVFLLIALGLDAETVGIFSLFMLGMFTGGVLHLAWDACTEPGTVPFFPVNETWKYSGTIPASGASDRRPGLYVLGLLVVAALLVSVQFLSLFSTMAGIVISGMLVLFAWIIILAKSGVKRV